MPTIFVGLSIWPWRDRYSSRFVFLILLQRAESWSSESEDMYRCTRACIAMSAPNRDLHASSYPSGLVGHLPAMAAQFPPNMTPPPVVDFTCPAASPTKITFLLPNLPAVLERACNGMIEPRGLGAESGSIFLSFSRWFHALFALSGARTPTPNSAVFSSCGMTHPKKPGNRSLEIYISRTC